MLKNEYSRAEDCYHLALALKKDNNIAKNINFSTSPYLEVVEGYYIPTLKSSFNNYKSSRVNFCYKFNNDSFLCLKIYDGINKHDLGQKLYVLRNLYLSLKKLFGEPTLFYTIKDDGIKSLNMEWRFNNINNVINEFKNGKPFDDGEIDKLIIFNEKNDLNLNEETRKYLTELIGLPMEMIELINEDINIYKFFVDCEDKITTSFYNNSKSTVNKKLAKVK